MCKKNLTILMIQYKRLQYIDCLRGAAMLIVVYSHVLSFMMGRLQPSPLGLYMRDIMLPLFFFISGFCAYKANVLSTIGRNTLEIYFIHFFLLFTIPVVPEWLNSLSSDACFGNRGCNSLPEFVIVGAISVFLCYVSIAIKKVVGLFPLVYELCFGPQNK